jgi:hypothetical protein
LLPSSGPVRNKRGEIISTQEEQLKEMEGTFLGALK